MASLRRQAVQRAVLQAVVVAIPVVAGCSERARLLFEPESSGVGPVTTIDSPETGVIRVPAGPMAVVSGRSVDDDGVDSLYVIIVGGNEHFNPLTPEEPTDTLRFQIPVSTSSHAGDTLTVLVYATDHLGVRGDTAARTLIVQ